MKATIYHNSRCSKSREALNYLEGLDLELEIVEYLKNPITFMDLDNVLRILNISPDDVIRKNEKDWKENFASRELNDEELIYSILEFPKLLQRPIVIIGDSGVIARPANLIDNLLK